MNTVTLDKTIDMAMQLPFEQQEMLLEIIQKRRVKINRQIIAEDAKASIATFHTGKLNPMSANEVIAELQQT